jgi:uncharacterized MAPEG superfamily protein
MNLAVACVPFTLLLVYALRVPMAMGQAKLEGGYDNSTPRVAQQRLTGLALRAKGAHENGFEAFMAFAAAIALAQGVGISSSPLVVGLALTHLVARIAYVAAYLADAPTLRSLVWTMGFAATLGIFGQALAHAA